jgi:hypothetical protein
MPFRSRQSAGAGTTPRRSLKGLRAIAPDRLHAHLARRQLTKNKTINKILITFKDRKISNNIKTLVNSILQNIKKPRPDCYLYG